MEKQTQVMVAHQNILCTVMLKNVKFHLATPEIYAIVTYVLNYFPFDKVVYHQNQGLPQRACDTGLLAGIYVDYVLEQNCLELFENHQIATVRR